MLTPSTPQFRKRRGKSNATATPPPPVENHILSVASGGSDLVVVTLSDGVTEIDPVSDALWVSIDGGTWSPATAVDLAGSPVLRFTVPDSLQAYLFWHVEDPSAYHMADGQPLLGPYDGSIG